MDTKAPMQQQTTAYSAGEKTPSAPGGGAWNTDLFDCFSGEDNLCLKGTFCPCFVYGKTQHRIRDPSMAGYESFNQDCLLWCGVNSCCGLGWIFTWMARTEIRKRFGLNGDGCTDCLAAWCCNCCSVIQNEKEVLSRSVGNTSAGYVAPAGMVVQPGGY